MNISKIDKYSIANGEGVRVSVFVSGCRRHCPGCHNPEAFDFNAGTEYTEEVESEILEALKPNYIQGLTILGGEPLEPENRKGVLDLIEAVRKVYGNGKDIWLYTGYTFSELCRKAYQRLNSFHQIVNLPLHSILQNIDVLVDGPFVQELADPDLQFRGSRNQGIIHLRYEEPKNE